MPADLPLMRPELCAYCERGTPELCMQSSLVLGRGSCIDRQRHWDGGFAAGTEQAAQPKTGDAS